MCGIWQYIYLKAIFSHSAPEISASVSLTYSKRFSFIPLYIQNVFTEEVVHVSLTAGFIEHFNPKKMLKIDEWSQNPLFKNLRLWCVNKIRILSLALINAQIFVF